MRAGHRSMEQLIGDMQALIARLVRSLGERQRARHEPPRRASRASRSASAGPAPSRQPP